MQVKVSKVGARTLKVSVEVEERSSPHSTKKGKMIFEFGHGSKFFSRILKERPSLFFLAGAGKTLIVRIDPRMSVEDFQQDVNTRLSLPSESFFLTESGKVLDYARVSCLTGDVSVRVHFRLRGMRVPRDLPGQWTCDYCGMNRCWPRPSTCYRCGEARGHTEEGRQHFRRMARDAREGGATNGSSAAAAAPTPTPWANKEQQARTVPPRTTASAPPWGPQPPAQRPAAEAAPHDSEQTALLRSALALIENYDLPKGVVDEIRKCVPPQRPAPKKQPEVSREQEMLNLKKKVRREDQELDQRKTALEIAWRACEEKQQKVMERATVVSDLKNQLAVLRKDIANNPTPEVSEDEGPAPEHTPLYPAGDNMAADLLEEKNPPVAERRGAFGSTEQDFQQWTVGLDRESVREAIAHLRAIDEQHEREEHARKMEAERASSCGAAAETESQCR